MTLADLSWDTWSTYTLARIHEFIPTRHNLEFLNRRTGHYRALDPESETEWRQAIADGLIASDETFRFKISDKPDEPAEPLPRLAGPKRPEPPKPPPVGGVTTTTPGARTKPVVPSTSSSSGGQPGGGAGTGPGSRTPAGGGKSNTGAGPGRGAATGGRSSTSNTGIGTGPGASIAEGRGSTADPGTGTGLPGGSRVNQTAARPPVVHGSRGGHDKSKIGHFDDDDSGDGDTPGGSVSVGDPPSKRQKGEDGSHLVIPADDPGFDPNYEQNPDENDADDADDINVDSK